MKAGWHHRSRAEKLADKSNGDCDPQGRNVRGERRRRRRAAVATGEPLRLHREDESKVEPGCFLKQGLFPKSKIHAWREHPPSRPPRTLKCVFVALCAGVCVLGGAITPSTCHQNKGRGKSWQLIRWPPSPFHITRASTKKPLESASADSPLLRAGEEKWRISPPGKFCHWNSQTAGLRFPRSRRASPGS